MPAGRPSKYFFLIKRLNDQGLYCAATIAWLLTKDDLRRRKTISGPLDDARTKVRLSLARVARLYDYTPSGVVHVGKRSKGHAYPGYTGEVWKQIFKQHQAEKRRRKK